MRDYNSIFYNTFIVMLLFFMTFNNTITMDDLRMGVFDIPFMKYSYLLLFIVFVRIIYKLPNTMIQKFSIKYIVLTHSIFFVMLINGFIYDQFLTTLNIYVWFIIMSLFLNYYIQINIGLDNNGKTTLIIKKILFPILLYSIISSLSALYLYYVSSISIFGYTASQIDLFTRLTGWYGNPNRIGTIIALGILISTIFFSIEKKKRYLFFILLLIFPLLLADSEGAIISLIISLFFLLGSREKIKKLFLFVTLCLTFIFFIVIFGYQLSLENISNGRIEIWKGMFDFWIQSPKSIFLGGITSSYYGSSPHNTYFYLLYSYGLFAFVLYALLLINLFLDFFEVKNRNKNILFSLISFITIRGLSTVNAFTISYDFVLFIVIIVMITSIPLDDKGDSEGGVDRNTLLINKKTL